MAQAGPSTQKKQKKKADKHAVRSSKARKVMQVKSIEALEQSVMQYVSDTHLVSRSRSCSFVDTEIILQEAPSDSKLFADLPISDLTKRGTNPGLVRAILPI